MRLSTPLSRRLGYAVWVYRYRGVLVDSGFMRASGRVGQFGTGVEAAVLTHWHEDHTGGARALIQKGVPVVAGGQTARAVNNMQAYPLPMYRRLVFGRPGSAEVTPVSEVGPLRLVATPGHSQDHQVLYDAGENILFSGDLYLAGRIGLATRELDLPALLNSLKRVIELAPRRMYCGHAGEVEDPIAKLVAKRDFILRLVEQVGKLHAKGLPVSRIAYVLLGPEPLLHYLSGGEFSRLFLVRQAERLV